MHHVRLAGKRRIAKLSLQRTNGDRDKYGDTIKRGQYVCMGFFLFPGAVLAGQGGESRGRFAGGRADFLPGLFFLFICVFFSCFCLFVCDNKEAGPGILPGH